MKKLKQLVKPVQEWDETITEQFHFRSGITVQEIIDGLGEDVDLSLAKFDISIGYYDEVEYYIEFPRLVRRKMTDELYAKKMAKYEKDLAARK